MNETLREIRTRLDAQAKVYAEARAVSDAADTAVRKVQDEYFIALLRTLSWCFLSVGWCNTGSNNVIHGSARFAAIIKDADPDRHSENLSVWSQFLELGCTRRPPWCAKVDSAHGAREIEVYVADLPPDVREHLVSPITRIRVEAVAKLTNAKAALARDQREVDQYTDLLKQLGG